MAQIKPFHLIRRPGGAAYYLEDWRQSPTALNQFGAYELLKRDLRTLFEYVEPSIVNAGTYSHRTFELLLRCCTEAETNFKIVAEANGHDWSQENIIRFSDMEGAMRLSEYEVACHGTDIPPFRPFEAFGAPARRDRSPGWYRSYNKAKHNRVGAFAQASFLNVVHAAGGVFVLLSAQYGGGLDTSIRRTAMGHLGVAYDVFRVTTSPVWPPEDQYEIPDWETLKATGAPHQNHPLPHRP